MIEQLFPLDDCSDNPWLLGMGVVLLLGMGVVLLLLFALLEDPLVSEFALDLEPSVLLADGRRW